MTYWDTWRAAAFAICVVLFGQTAVAGDSQEWLAAQVAVKTGDKALRNGEYAAAVTSYEAAKRFFENAGTRQDARRAGQLAKYCRGQILYAHNKRLLEQQTRAEKVMESGSIEDSVAQMQATGAEFLELAKKYDHQTFFQNAEYCLGRSGLLAIRLADDARKRKEWETAVRGYDQAIRAYSKAHEILGQPKFANNLKYAHNYLPEARFEVRLANHDFMPDCRLAGMNGQAIRLASFRGKTTLVIVWAQWCGYCRKDLPIVNRFWETHRMKGIEVVGICVDRVEGWSRGRAQQAEEFARKSLGFANGWATPEVLNLLGNPQGVPRAFWLDSAGRLNSRVSLDDLTVASLAAQIPSNETERESRSRTAE